MGVSEGGSGRRESERAFNEADRCPPPREQFENCLYRGIEPAPAATLILPYDREEGQHEPRSSANNSLRCRLLLLPRWETCGLVLVCPILSVCTFRQRYSS